MKKNIYSKNITIFIVACLFLSLLTLLRITWLNFIDIPDSVTAKQGTVDLSGIDTSNFMTQLNGEWEFYPNTLRYLEHSNQNKATNNRVYSHLPETWDTYFENKNDVHYGTYRLKVLKNHDAPQLYGITIPDSLSTYELYINGQMIGGLGNLSTDTEFSAPTGRPTTYYFTLDSSDSEIIIQGANMNRYTQGGFSKAIILGDLQSMEQLKWFAVITQIIMFLVFIIYLFYTILLYTIGIREKSLIYFSLLVSAIAVTILVSSNKFLFMYIPLNWIWASKIFFFSYMLNFRTPKCRGIA